MLSQRQDHTTTSICLLTITANTRPCRYRHFADETRAEQDAIPDIDAKVGILGLLWPSKKTQHVDYSTARRNSAQIGLPAEKGLSGSDSNGSPEPTRVNVSEEEWMNASRAVRQASGAACFYLITTDILGPFGLAYSFATVGWA